MVSLTLNTLGRLEICWGGQPVPELKLRKSQALLIYLALNPGSHDRSRLAGLLWGDLPQNNARRNLRHALHRLRRSLSPEILEDDRLSAGLNLDIPIHVDALDFEADIARAARCRRARNDAASAGYLKAAADRYQGDFLYGFDVPDCLEFDEWVTRRRAQMREQILDVLDALVTHFTRRGAYEQALSYARRLLALEPLWERSHRQMMALLALTGQRSAALAQYQECRRVLEVELGLEPLEETEALYRRLVNGEIEELGNEETGKQRAGGAEKPMCPSVFSSSGTALARLPFTGRREEHAALLGWWEASQRNAGQLALVEGEAGVGKTRLVEEVLRYITSQGATVLRGRCYEFGGGLPYQPIAQALRSQIVPGDSDGERTFSQSSISPIWLAELARLLPDLHRAFPNLPEAQSITGGAARQRLFEAVARFLRAVSGSSCLFLDDLHWADRSTLDLLHYVIRHLENTSLWIVGTYRPEEVTPSHPLTRLRQGLSRDHRLAHLTLAPLSNASVQTLARSLVGEREGTALGDFLYRESEGNPFILVETISDLQEQGALVAARMTRDDLPPSSKAILEDGRWVWTGSPSTETLPVSVQDIILQRVGRLSEPAQRLLTLAAVVGQAFDRAILCAAAGRDADKVEKALDEWLTRRLIQSRPVPHFRPPSPIPQYDFSHDKIRAVVYHAARRAKRQRLHRRVGQALERVFSDRVDAYVGLLAFHWEQAQELERATTYLLRAGDQARQVYAHQEAAGYYRRALAILERQGGAGRERAARTLIKLGQVYHGAFDFCQARQAYVQGLDLWQRASGTRSLDVPSPVSHPLRLRWLEPTTLDPALSPDSHTSSVLTQIFSGLLRLSPEMDILPDVAHAWDVSEDGRRYVFYLRDDVWWSDGVPVTAGDFVYAWKRVLDPVTDSPVAGCLYDIKGARAFHQGQADREGVGVRAIDETTLIVELEEPTGYFLQLLVSSDCFPVPRHVVKAHGAVWTAPGNLVTNGPFCLERWQRGEVLSLARNPDYHGAFQGNVQRVTLFPVTDWSTRWQMYEDDALDVLGITFFPPKKRDLARRRYASEHVVVPILETCYLVFDVNRPPFDDVRVRQALALSTDRGTLVERVLHNHAAPATGGLLPQGMPGHSPDIGLPYDPDRAQSLLAEAGYPEGRGFPALDALAFRAVEARTAYLQKQWRQVLGIEVSWQTPRWATFLDQLRGARHHVLCAMWVADYPDPDNFLRVSRAETWAGWQHEGYDRLVKEARRVMGQAERIRRYRRAEKILVTQAPILPLTYEQEHLLIKPWVTRYPSAASRAVFWKDVVIEPHAPPAE